MPPTHRSPHGHERQQTVHSELQSSNPLIFPFVFLQAPETRTLWLFLHAVTFFCLLQCAFPNDKKFVYITSPEAKEYVTALNHNDPNLQFNECISNTQDAYLTRMVYIEDNKLQATLYRKPIAGNSILHVGSFHPRSVTGSIPYGELLRIKRNCSTTEEYKKATDSALNRSRERHYSKGILQEAVRKTDTTQRKQILFERDKTIGGKKEDHKIGMINDYTVKLSEVYQIFRRNWRIRKSDTILCPHLPPSPLITY